MVKSGFNLKELLSERSLQKQGERQQEEELENIMVDVHDLIPSKDNFYSMDVSDLKPLIRAFGVLQPLLIKPEGGKYKIQAGHRRHKACLELVEEGEEWLKRIPCVIKPDPESVERQKRLEIILDQMLLIAANKFRDKTEWEKMEEALQQEELIAELKKEGNLPGRTRSMLAEYTGLKEAQLGRYKAIKNNLCMELMEEFKADHIGSTIAYEASGLSPEYQQMAVELFLENGILTGPDVKGLKAQEEKEKQIPGQIKWPDNEIEEEKEDQEENAGQQAGDPLNGCMNPPEDPESGDQEDGEEETEEDQQAEDPEDNKATPEEDKQESAKIVYVQQEAPKQHGCGFCHPEHHREISSQQGNFLLAYDPETKLVEILSKETGSVETIIFHKCPMCGREL